MNEAGQDVACHSCPIVQESIFKDAPEHVAEAIAQHKQVVAYGPGHRIFSEGEPGAAVYCVASGTVRLVKGRGDDEHAIGQARAGTLIGYRQPTPDGAYIVSAIAETEVVLCRIPMTVLQQGIVEAPEVALELMRSLAARADELEERLSP